jgi:hypothetical protein
MSFQSQASQASMTDLEYVQNMPAAHLLLQQRVNKQLWHVWNLADHTRAIAHPYYSEMDINSQGVDILEGRGHVDNNGPPPALTLGYSICSRRWRQEQEGYMNARIGDIVFAKNGTGMWDTSGVLITYALERIDEPRRWNKYRVRHLASERFEDVIREHNANDAAPATTFSATHATTILPSAVAVGAALEQVDDSDDDEEKYDD